MEFGPYNYREYDNYDDLVWTKRMDNLTQIEQDIVLATFN